MWEKKEARCTPADKERGLGDCWDVAVVDVKSRAVVAFAQGPRTSESINAAFGHLRERLAPGHVPGLVTTDEFAAYAEAVLVTFGVETPSPPVRASGRQPLPTLEPDPRLTYAQVDKQRAANGRLKRIDTRILFGSPETLEARLGESSFSTTVNTACVERLNGVARHFNPRTARATCEFSKALFMHRAVSWLTMATAIFCWASRTLRRFEEETGRWLDQSSAMILNRADHVLSIEEFIWLRPIGFVAPTREDLRLKQVLFQQPEKPPPLVEHWPEKGIVRKSLKKLGVSARGIG